MPTRVYESLIKITHGSTVVLDWGDDVTGEPTLDGGQLVDVVPLLRATGVKTHARGNEQHRLSIPVAKEALSIRGATDQLFAGALAVPRGTATVTIEVQNGGTWTMADATIESWNAVTEDHFTTRTLDIIGGSLSEIA